VYVAALLCALVSVGTSVIVPAIFPETTGIWGIPVAVGVTDTGGPVGIAVLSGVLVPSRIGGTLVSARSVSSVGVLLPVGSVGIPHPSTVRVLVLSRCWVTGGPVLSGVLVLYRVGVRTLVIAWSVTMSAGVLLPVGPVIPNPSMVCVLVLSGVGVGASVIARSDSIILGMIGVSVGVPVPSSLVGAVGVRGVRSIPSRVCTRVFSRVRVMVRDSSILPVASPTPSPLDFPVTVLIFPVNTGVPVIPVRVVPGPVNAIGPLAASRITVIVVNGVLPTSVLCVCGSVSLGRPLGCHGI
jgi:hypothetical protein